jgi:hypothetical protein
MHAHARPEGARPGRSQVWKFPKGLSLRDLRAHLEHGPAAPPALPGSAQDAAALRPPASAPRSKRPSALRKGEPGWAAHLQQACSWRRL